ncbi:MAG: hydantoinase B/oxoprolinase family protein [Rhodobacteraceae bacterium]|nr:hydantoinase B/oxoprolinase family protein [Paracoccaceae bacterium]
MMQTTPRFQVLWSRLLSVVEEQGQALMRAAFSLIVRECGDISAGIFDIQGRMLAQTVTGTPGHINTMAKAVTHLCARFPLQGMRPGDIYMTNDPWIASGHLNDFLLLMPVFHKNRVIGFTSCTSHPVDFAGSDPVAGKGINVPLNYATAYTVFALRCLIGPDIPNNAGSLAPFRVTAPPGCILNARHPAPVAMRHSLGQMMPDLVYGCLSQALHEQVPAEGASCMYDLPLRHAPEAHKCGDTLFALELVLNGGTGAQPQRDGLSATAFPSGVWGSQIETTEAVAPVLFNRRELRCDSGGTGKRRGGLGQRIEIRAAREQDLMLFLSVERVKIPAAGRYGGGPGAAGRIRLASGEADLPGKGEIRIPAGETLILETPGGGGYGPATERAADKLAEDVRAGLVSPAAARNVYGGSV